MHYSITRYQKKPDAQQEQIDNNVEVKEPCDILRFESILPLTNCCCSGTCATTTASYKYF